MLQEVPLDTDLREPATDQLQLNTWKQVTLSNHGWAALSETGGPLEGAGELEHTEIVAVTAHDLHPDRQSVRGAATGYRDRR